MLLLLYAILTGEFHGFLIKMNMRKLYIFTSLFLGLFVLFIFTNPARVSAHSGNTDAYGGHTCYTNCPSYGLYYGEYHYHNSGYNYSDPYGSYNYTPSTPSCPSNSYYDSLSGNCRCLTGYVVGTNFLGEEACVTADSWCEDKYGLHAGYDSLSDTCDCDYGYQMYGGSCVSDYSYCQQKYGFNASYDFLEDACVCNDGYFWNGYSCEYDSSSYSGFSSLSCPENSYLATDGSCYCDLGYTTNSLNDACVPITCPDNATLIGDSCFCNSGFELNSSATACIQQAPMDISTEGDQPPPTTLPDEQTPLSIDQTSDPYVQSQIDQLSTTDSQLVNKLKGRILLQVEDHGEAWYLDPITLKRYYMRDGPTAYEMLRAFGLGITNADLEKVQAGNQTLINKLRGRIVLQVETHGEAYYIHPVDGSVHYLRDGAAAYSVMRNLSLGITNTDLRKIPIEKFIPIK